MHVGYGANRMHYTSFQVVGLTVGGASLEVSRRLLIQAKRFVEPN